MRSELADIIRANHYTHSVPSGKSWYYQFEDAVVVFSIPPNKNISSALLGRPNAVAELARLWAPDGHRPNLLTEALSVCVAEFHRQEPGYEALVSYADPNVGHEGGVYRAASWTYLGQCEEGRYYRKDGQVVSRRKFHSGARSLKKAEIIALGYEELKLPGKQRFAKGLTRKSRAAIRRLAK